MTVLLSHAASNHLSGGFLWPIKDLGMEAVVVFFVLSGFVITYAAEERERSAQTFAINRMARIYSVALPALILTFVLDGIGRSMNPDAYSGWMVYLPDHIPWQFLNSVFFTNEVWYNHVTPGINRPYWSMGYEVPYYFAFGIAAFAPRAWAFPGAALVMLIAGPNVAALFPMWLLGLASYRFCVSRPLGKWAGMTLWSFSLVGLILVVFPSRDRNPLFGNISLTPERLHDLLHFYLVALLFAANVIGFRGASPLVASLLNWATKPICWMGQRTFAIYLFHVPIMQFVVAAAPWPVTSWITRSMIFLGVPLVVFGLAEITERRKDAWRRGFAALLGWASEAKPAA